MKPVELDLESIPRRSRTKRVQPSHKKRGMANWRRVARSLRVDGPQSKRALAVNLNLAPRTINWLVDWYLDHGIVERVGRKYRLTEKHANYGKPSPRRTPTSRPKKPTSWSRGSSDEEIIGV